MDKPSAKVKKTTDFLNYDAMRRVFDTSAIDSGIILGLSFDEVMMKDWPPKKKENPEIICEEFLVFELNGNKQSGRIFLGKPYQYDELMWQCPFGVEGIQSLEGKLNIDIPAGSSFHALLLAVSLIQTFLNGYEEEGGSVLYPDSSKFDIDGYFASCLNKD